MLFAYRFVIHITDEGIGFYRPDVPDPTAGENLERPCGRGRYDESHMAGEIEKLGVSMLINEAVEISRAGSSLWVVGVDDPHCDGFDDLDGALLSAPDGAFKVLLVTPPRSSKRRPERASIFVFAVTFMPGRFACR